MKYRKEVIQQIGNIGNYYGGLYIKKENKKYYFGIEDYSGTECIEYEEISEKLYMELLQHQQKLKGNK
jgi:hypothetical protein